MASINALTAPPPADAARSAIFQLAEWIRGDTAIADIEVDPVDPILTAVPPSGPVINVTCRSRVVGGRDELWFFDSAGRPITDAGNIADAALAVRERVLSPL